MKRFISIVGLVLARRLFGHAVFGEQSPYVSF